MREEKSERIPPPEGRSKAGLETPLHFKIRGMDCAEEVMVLKREVGPVVGGEDRLSFDIFNGKMSVAPGPESLSSTTIIQAVERTGMQAEAWQDVQEPAIAEGFWQRRGRMILTAASGLLSLAGFLWHAWVAGEVGAALGSEGMGLSHAPPLAAEALYA
ncbi:MAG: heavy metal translocating P-type ATPase, partial [Candidatus Binatia bacterium]